MCDFKVGLQKCNFRKSLPFNGIREKKIAVSLCSFCFIPNGVCGKMFLSDFYALLMKYDSGHHQNLKPLPLDVRLSYIVTLLFIPVEWIFSRVVFKVKKLELRMIFWVTFL